MALSPLLIRKLEETLGRDAAEDLVSHLDRGDDLRADLAELRHEMQLGFARIDARFAAIDERFVTLDQKFGIFDQKFGILDQKFVTLDQQFGIFDQKFVTFDQKLDGVRLEIREQIAGATARLLKWSFVFWVSAVGAIAGLAGVLK